MPRPAVHSPVDDEAANRLVGTSIVPPVLYEPILARLYSPETDIGVVTAAATVGSTFSVSTLTHLVRRTPARLRQALIDLCEAGVLEAVDHDRYRFRHSLLRDVAYELQPLDVRHVTHRTVADALSRDRAAGRSVPWGLIARHFHSAQARGAAVDAYERAADEARDLGALGQGRAELTTSIELVAAAASDAGNGEEANLGPQREASLRLKRAFLDVSAGGNADPRALADYERCERLTKQNPDDHRFVDTLVGLWGYHAMRGDMTRAGSMLDAIDRTGATDDPLTRAENDAGRAVVDFFSGRLGAADTAFDAVAREFEMCTVAAPERSRWSIPGDALSAMHAWAAATRWQRGDVVGFDDRMDRARRRAATLRFPDGPFSTCQALYAEAWVYAEMGLVDRSSTAADQLIGLAARHGFDFWQLVGGAARAYADARRLLGDADPDRDAVRACAVQLEQAEMFARLSDTRSFSTYTVTLRAVLLMVLGEHEQALAALDDAGRIAEETGTRFYRAESLRHRGYLRHRLGLSGGIAEVSAAAELAAGQGATVFELRALDDLKAAGELTDQQRKRRDALRCDDGVVAAVGPVFSPRAPA